MRAEARGEPGRPGRRAKLRGHTSSAGPDRPGHFLAPVHFQQRQHAQERRASSLQLAGVEGDAQGAVRVPFWQ